MNNGYRFYEIDFLRFIAATSVLFYHYAFRGYYADNMTTLSFPCLGYFARYGYLGFHLFFIISGFVILLSAYNKNASDFVISRMARLYPAYWFSVTLTFITILMLGGSLFKVNILQFLVNMTMLQGSIGVEPIDGIYWTLNIELRFYFIIFLLIYFNQINKIEYYLGAWLLITLLLTIFKTNYIITYLFFPDYSSYFIAGCFFYLINRNGINFYYISLISITYFLAVYNILIKHSFMVNYFHADFNLPVTIILMSIFYLIFIIISSWKIKSFNNHKFYLLGVLTYPLYLIHQNIGFMLFNILDGYLNKYIILFSVTLTMFMAAYLIHIYIEKKYSKMFRSILIKLYNRLEYNRHWKIF